ncbi:N-acetylmuramic acid/N-acetylglucosamine kinase [Clostridia bacterium]|nr:N-acetylmuramic acid/N-acetylglucosamine kinase [Clostridia bacterium]
MYYIGIDGGAAYSRLVAADESGKIIGRHTGGSSNVKGRGRDAVLDALKKLISEFFRLTSSDIKDCAGLCIGSPCVETEEDVKVVLGIFREIGLEKNVAVVNDAEIVLETETRGGAGIVILAGESAAGYAVDNGGKKYRAGGWGNFDAVGSSQGIGAAAINKAFMSSDGRIEKTTLLPQILEHFKLTSVDDLENYVNNPEFPRQKLSPIAQLVKNAAKEGDAAAKEIENDAAGALAKIAVALIRRSKIKEPKIVLSGASVVANDNIRAGFSAQIRAFEPSVNIVSVREKAELGAVYIAMKNAGVKVVGEEE